VYAGKAATDLSWYRPDAGASMRLVEAALRRTGATPGAAVDVGCGTSTLLDELLAAGWGHVTGLDVSVEALSAVRRRLAGRPATEARVDLVVTDVLRWRPDTAYDLWHDRAVLHFLTEADDQHAYVEVATGTVAPGGVLVLGTFGSEGPEQCSGLPVRRYAAHELAELFANGFDLVAEEVETHRTPWGSTQEFTWATLLRR
jgi:SAM-dependent methyltransferase